MCNHRAVNRWQRFWDRFGLSFLLSFLAAEIYGLITVGPEATWSESLRRRAGLLEPCRHSSTGRFVIVTFAVWLGAHLGWGFFGLSGKPAAPKH